MPGTTSRLDLPFPELDDAADGPEAVQELAEALDNVAPISHGTLANRPTSTTGSPGIEDRLYYATDIDILFRDTGTGWDGVGTNETVTSLPNNPPDGMEINFVADAANGVVWKLKYRNASASAYKWEFIGGSRLSAEVVGAQGAQQGGSAADDERTGNQTTQSTTWADLATVGPSITLPLPGDYDIALGCRMISDPSASGGRMGYAIGGAGPTVADSIELFRLSTADIDGISLFRESRKLGLGAVTLTAKYVKTGAAGVAEFNDRVISARPVRVG